MLRIDVYRTNCNTLLKGRQLENVGDLFETDVNHGMTYITDALLISESSSLLFSFSCSAKRGAAGSRSCYINFVADGINKDL